MFGTADSSVISVEFSKDEANITIPLTVRSKSVGRVKFVMQNLQRDMRCVVSSESGSIWGPFIAI